MHLPGVGRSEMRGAEIIEDSEVLDRLEALIPVVGMLTSKGEVLTQSWWNFTRIAGEGPICEVEGLYVQGTSGFSSRGIDRMLAKDHYWQLSTGINGILPGRSIIMDFSSLAEEIRYRYLSDKYGLHRLNDGVMATWEGMPGDYAIWNLSDEDYEKALEATGSTIKKEEEDRLYGHAPVPTKSELRFIHEVISEGPELHFIDEDDIKRLFLAEIETPGEPASEMDNVWFANFVDITLDNQGNSNVYARRKVALPNETVVYLHNSDVKPLNRDRSFESYGISILSGSGPRYTVSDLKFLAEGVCRTCTYSVETPNIEALGASAFNNEYPGISPDILTSFEGVLDDIAKQE